MTISRVWGARRRPRNAAAAARRSSRRPLVQVPISTWSSLHVAELARRMDVVDGVRRRDHRHELVDEDELGALVGRVVVGRQRAPVGLAALGGEERLRRLVGGDEAGLGARLDRHVGERQARVHRQRLDRRAAELERLVGGAVGAEPADEREDDVLGLDAGRQRAADLDAERLGHAQPGLAGRHADRHVGRAHAGGEGAQRAGRARVGVGADDDVAGLGEALGDALVADALVDVGQRRAALGAELADDRRARWRARSAATAPSGR